jgi:hypothetical protein
MFAPVVLRFGCSVRVGSAALHGHRARATRITEWIAAAQGESEVLAQFER